jgi:hypothetical protein
MHLPSPIRSAGFTHLILGYITRKIFGEEFVYFWRDSPPPLPQWVMASSFTRNLNHTPRRSTFGRTPLVEWSARRRDLYLTTQNRWTSMSPVGFFFFFFWFYVSIYIYILCYILVSFFCLYYIIVNLSGILLPCSPVTFPLFLWFRFEPTISAGKRPQTYALDRAATETGCGKEYRLLYSLHLLPPTCSLLVPNILRSTLSSFTASLCFSLTMKGQVPYPSKTTKTSVYIYIYIYVCVCVFVRFLWVLGALMLY